MPRTPSLRTGVAMAAVLCAGAVAAQTPPRDAVADLLPAQAAPAAAEPSIDATVADGGTYGRAPDAEQDPEEVRITRALNAEVTAQNALADNQESGDREAADAARREVEAQAAVQASARIESSEAGLRAAAEAQRRHDLVIADWRATVRACERGNKARCRAGSQPARTPF